MEPEETRYDSLPIVLSFSSIANLNFFKTLEERTNSTKKDCEGAKKVLCKIIDNTAVCDLLSNSEWLKIRTILLNLKGIYQNSDDHTKLTTIQEIRQELKFAPKDKLIIEVGSYAGEEFYSSLRRDLAHDIYEESGWWGHREEQGLNQEFTNYRKSFEAHLDAVLILDQTTSSKSL